MKPLLAVTLLIALAGCGTYAYETKGSKINNNLVTGIETGVTTRGEIINMFGTPTEIMVEDTDELLIYEFVEKKTPTYYGVKGLRSSTRIKKDTLEIKIKDEKVVYYRFKSVTN